MGTKPVKLCECVWCEERRAKCSRERQYAALMKWKAPQQPYTEVRAIGRRAYPKNEWGSEHRCNVRAARLLRRLPKLGLQAAKDAAYRYNMMCDTDRLAWRAVLVARGRGPDAHDLRWMAKHGYRAYGPRYEWPGEPKAA